MFWAAIKSILVTLGIGGVFGGTVLLIALIVGFFLKFLPVERKVEDETDLMIYHGEDRRVVPMKSIHEGEDHDC
jgi:hypothetical protein